MRIAVVGGGAIGCYLAAKLSGRGHDLSVVARPEQARAIAEHGLLLRDPRGEAVRYPLHATTTLDTDPDLVLLAVKTQDVAAACTMVRERTGDTPDGPPVVCLQNGVQADRLASDILGRERIAGVVVMSAATYLWPGEVSVEFPGWLIVGEPFGPPRRRTRAIAGVLGSAVTTYTTRHLPAVRWSKLITNLNNGLCAATGLLPAQIMASRRGRVLPVRVMREGYRVARAAGVSLDHGFYGFTWRAARQDRRAATVAVLQAALPALLATLPEAMAVHLLALASRTSLGRLPIRGSTWQSVARGRPSEVEYLNGEIVRQAARLGLEAPYNQRVVEAVCRVERTGQFCPLEALLLPDVPDVPDVPAVPDVPDVPDVPAPAPVAATVPHEGA